MLSILQKKQIMEGNKIKYSDGNMVVPNDPIIPFIEGDGIGVDIGPQVSWYLTQQ